MSNNTIALLPNHVANQIAAGEVVQRPSSVVKELLENAIDAGATHIKLIIKDAGKSLIQVIDNGKGMNPFDARMCFERHATSKITSSDDLFALTTKGFRGEALASIAAIAQVELKTKRADDIVGQHIVIDGGKFISQSECQCSNGTTFIVKNLFFNVPARRNFLKNDQIEQKHIIDEIERVAIPHTDIHFVFQSNGNDVLNLPPGNLIQRIKSLVGSYIQKELVAISEDTNFVKIRGYVSLPESAIKSRKEQYFFVNNRFVKNPFLNHAIYEAYKDLITYQSHPRYFLFLEMDPKNIDINIHPTKTEVKFTDDKSVYMLLVSSIKRALGKASAGPSLDFDSEMSLNIDAQSENRILTQPKVSYNQNYNPFNSNTSSSSDNSLQKANKQHWETMFDGFKNTQENTEVVSNNTKQNALEELKSESVAFSFFQLNKKYIVTTYNKNVLIVDQQRAHERIVYEHYLKTKKETKITSQQLLFPEQMELSANDFTLIKGLTEEFRILGFDFEVFGKNSIVINGTPSDLKDFKIIETIEGVLETFKLNTIDSKIEKHDNLCRAIAYNTCIKYGKHLDEEEIRLILEHLFNCENPLYTASGKSIMMEIDYLDIEKYFKK
ncbi:MAG: DNA mismatch repair endonuclease MutL [Bacteroidota bacterium]|nr:DNA mismatch repair endonuclease MutL [Bacteroidota bacterium]MDP3146609.1 DNA mismatch repair endonuclease MutL [Bacteroidota bacterium]